MKFKLFVYKTQIWSIKKEEKRTQFTTKTIWNTKDLTEPGLHCSIILAIHKNKTSPLKIHFICSQVKEGCVMKWAIRFLKKKKQKKKTIKNSQKWGIHSWTNYASESLWDCNYVKWVSKWILNIWSTIQGHNTTIKLCHIYMQMDASKLFSYICTCKPSPKSNPQNQPIQNAKWNIQYGTHINNKHKFSKH